MDYINVDYIIAGLQKVELHKSDYKMTELHNIWRS